MNAPRLSCLPPAARPSRRLRCLFACGSLLAFTSNAGAEAPSPVRLPPSILTPPRNTTVTEGDTASLSVSASSNDPMSYLWRLNGVPVRGAVSATPSTLTIPNAQFANAGKYDVVVTNKYGSTTTSAATLTVVAAAMPVITTQPVSRTIDVGQTVTFTATVSGAPAPVLQWRKNGANIPGATSTTLTIFNAQPADSGSYEIFAMNTRGSTTSQKAVLTFAGPATVITTQPASRLIDCGATAAFDVRATGRNLRYQWKRNGVALAGATDPSYSLASAAWGDMGFYSVVVSGDDGAVESDVAILTITAGGATGRLVNLSTRAFVPAGGALTPGFTFSAAGSKQLLIRAVGPALASFGVAGSLSDPKLVIVPTGSTAAMLANDDWCTGGNSAAIAATSAVVGAFPFATESKDATVLATLGTAAGRGYTTPVTSNDAEASGLVLAEIYDADPLDAPVRLTTVSTLAFVGRGANALVSGFTIGGTEPKRLLIRAVGPGLAQFGLGDVLADPQLTVIPLGQTFAVARNDNWGGGTTLADAFAQAGAFALARDSSDAALIVRLPPGGYTVTVTGAGDTTGPALVEIYDLDP